MLRACHVTTCLLSILLLKLSAQSVHPGTAFVFGCHESERKALLKFKQSLVDTQNRLSSWEGNDCCHWKGVGCDNVTLHVNRLDLHDPYCDPNDDYNDEPSRIAAPKLDHSLLELSRLSYLKLSCVDFQGSRIPRFIGLFEHLRYLNLSYSSFSGVVPSEFGNLTRLHTLDLSTNNGGADDALSSDLRWVSTLGSLRYLNLNGALISPSTNSTHVLDIPPLLGLQLSNCQLHNPSISRIFSNFTVISTIQQLDLSNNFFEGSIPVAFANMTSLRYLDLSTNQLNGSVPFWHRNMRGLRHLDLSHNNFSQVEGGDIIGILPTNLCELKSVDLSHNSIVGELGAHHNISKCVAYDLENLQLGSNMIEGTLPSWLWNFKRLRILDIQSNAINGRISQSIGSLLYLEELYLSENYLTGTLPDSLGDLIKLRFLVIGHNEIHGEIPTSIEKLSSLETLDLSQNNINGPIPIGLKQCTTLVTIDLSSNSLHGVVSETLFNNLSSLEYIDLSSNSLEVNLSLNWEPPFQLTELDLRSCKIRTQFPQWIGNQTYLLGLDLSDNMLYGKIIPLFSSGYLRRVNISHNQLTGSVPHFNSPSIDSLDLSYNLLSGPLVQNEYPSTKNDAVGIPVCQLSSSLAFLDLHRNNIIGTIPDCWGVSDTLVYINLSSNRLSGIIPKSIGDIPYLQFLKLSNNSLRGSIPLTLNSSSKLKVLDLGENKLIGSIPTWGAKSHPLLQILRLPGNRLKGGLPTTLCSLPVLQLIDFANNNLSGVVPHCFGNLSGMKLSTSEEDLDYLDYGYDNTDFRDGGITVTLKGAELQYTTTLKFVVNLDLSCNALVGSIPEEITNLTSLVGLNLSYNHLVGRIPKKIGGMKSLMSLDLSNNNLSGTIPSSISDLTALSNINLSNNKLRGQIPTGEQLQTLTDPSAYGGNPGLCGDPLPNKCKTIQAQNQPQREPDDHGEENDLKNPLFYFVIISGIATGFWAVVGSLLLKDRFNFTLFRLVGIITDYLYLQVLARLNRFRN